MTIYSLNKKAWEPQNSHPVYEVSSHIISGNVKPASQPPLED